MMNEANIGQRLVRASLMLALDLGLSACGPAPGGDQAQRPPLEGARIGGPFTLTDHTGNRRSLSDFKGRFTLLYFGFTSCPDICPTDLYSMTKAVEELGVDGEKVNLVFVTLDPERDTPPKLAQYISLFHPRLVALTGTPAEIRDAANLYKVYFRKTKLGEREGDYTIDHSAFIYLLNPEGRYLGFYPPNTSPDRIAQIVRQWLHE